jgi:hypothetical protein
MSENNNKKPNAFVFKVLIEGEYRMCVCPRIDGHWSEKDIFYIDNPIKELYDALEERLFNVIFVVYEKEADGGFWIRPPNDPKFLKSDTAIAFEMYRKGQFFTAIEDGYQQLYEQQTSGQGGQTPSSEEKSV